MMGAEGWYPWRGCGCGPKVTEASACCEGKLLDPMAQLTQASRQIQGFDLVSLPATEGVLRSKMSLQIWRVVSVLETAHAAAAAAAAQAQAEARGLHEECHRLLNSNIKLEKDCSTAIDANQMLQVSIRYDTNCLRSAFPALTHAPSPCPSRGEQASGARLPSGSYFSTPSRKILWRVQRTACASLQCLQRRVCSESAQREHWLQDSAQTVTVIPIS
jgi:hypothetical protein